MQDYIKIILVDDDKDVTRIIQEALSIYGYEKVTCAGDGEEAVRAYPEVLPDLVLMDIDMPVMDGYEAARRIRALDPDARIVVITGNTSDIRARRTLEEGLVRTVLQKPIRLWDLKAIVDAHAYACSASEPFSSSPLPPRESTAFGPLP